MLLVALGALALEAFLPPGTAAAALLWVASQNPGLAALALTAGTALKKQPPPWKLLAALLANRWLPGPGALLYPLLERTPQAACQSLLSWALTRATDPLLSLVLLLASLTTAIQTRPKPPLQIEQARQELSKAAGKLDSTSAWTTRLLQGQDRGGVAEIVLSIALEQQPCRSAALFMPDEEGRLVPLAYRSPYRQRLETAAVLGRTEPVVQEAWERGKPQHRESPTGGSERIFLHERPVVALPLGKAGVLYLGAPEGDFGLDRLAQLAPLAADALEAAVEQERARARGERLEERVNLMSRLLEGMRALASTLDEETLLRYLEAAAFRLVPHRGGSLTRQGNVLRRWGDPGEGPTLAADLDESGDTLVLVGTPNQTFLRDHQTALTLLASMAGLSLQNASHHRQLLLTGKMAAVGQLAAGVAHEINNPLMAISTDAEMLAVTDQPEMRQELLEAIRLTVGRARQITGQLLSFARGGAGERQPLKLAPLLDGLSARFPVELSFEDLTVIARPEEVQQILVNLLQNAVLAVEGQPEPRIQLTVRAEGSSVRVDVSDNGCGIPAENQARIFEPFFTTRDVGAGTGMGLFLAYTMARSLGGTLELVGSNPTQFCLKLPQG